MYEGGSSRFADAAAALAVVREAACAENRDTARKVLAAAEMARLCWVEDAERLGEDGIERAGMGAAADLGLVLGVSGTVAQRMIDIGTLLWEKLPHTRVVFEAGRLDFSRVRVIVETLGEVDSTVIAVIEGACVEAARYRAPQALRNEIMRLICSVSPEEAARLRRERETYSRRVTITPDTHGMAKLLAVLTATEAITAGRRIDEMAATVCEHDPRPVRQLRTDAFLGLLNGERQLACGCGSDGCPVAHYEPAPRTATQVHVHVDAATLLGLIDNPANLTGHGPIDPELARTLAADGTWRVIIDRARTAAATTPPGEQAAGEQTDQQASSEQASSEQAPGEQASSVQAPGAQAPGVRVPRRGVGLVAGYVAPEPAPVRGSVTPVVSPVPVTGAGKVIADTLAAIAADPSLLDRPDGHGGYTVPPPGALKYHRTAAVKRAVFAKYATCTFPSCRVPARRCEWEHAVEFDHDNPLLGGWTIVENGHLACKYHHDLKTDGHYRVVLLPGDIVAWISRTGVIGITLPDSLIGHDTDPLPPMRPGWEPAPDPPPPPPDDDDPIYQPTWWEDNACPGDRPPSPAQIAVIEDPDHRSLCHALRGHYDTHLAVLDQRQKHAPPPF